MTARNASAMIDRSLRLTWSRTWPDKPEDFVCHDAGNQVGRVHSSLKAGSVEMEWRWALNGFLPEWNVWLTTIGINPTKQEAAEALEAAYFAAVERLAANIPKA